MGVHPQRLSMSFGLGSPGLPREIEAPAPSRSEKRHLRVMDRPFTPLAFLFILLLALALQVAQIPSYPLKFDQAQVLSLARGVFTQGVFPLHGILNSLRAYNPPFFVWLYVLPMAVTEEPSVILVLPALVLHAASMVILFLLGERYVGPRGGLAAAAIYGFSPQGLYFGHSSWAQGLLPSFYLLLLYCLARWLLEGKGWHAASALFLAAWATGIHWAGALTLGVVVVLPFVLRGRPKWAPVLVGAALSVLVWAPYLGFEKQRSFSDLRALLEGPVGTPEAHELTGLCVGAKGSQGEQEASGRPGSFKDTLRARWPWAYRVGRGAGGIVAAAGVNFHWAPLSARPWAGTWREVTGFALATCLFLTGLVMLLRGVARGIGSHRPEAFILLGFVVPAVLQNLSPHTTLARPDGAWLFFGPQALIVSHSISSPRGIPWRAARIGAAVALSVLLFINSYGDLRGLLGSLKAPPHPQRQLVSWIARDAAMEGTQRVSVRYDFLRERPQWCWIVPYSLLDPSYRVGAEFDYLLGLHGIENCEKAPDGWARDPGYIVLFREGLKRYNEWPWRCEVAEFGPYAVLKVHGRGPRPETGAKGGIG